MNNSVVVSDITNLANGGQINYTLSSTTTPGSPKTLEVVIRAPNGSILASSTNSYDNRSQVQSAINSQLDSKQQQVDQELTQVQSEISSLTSILNNPNTPPNERRTAEAQLEVRQEEQTNLEKDQTNITTTKTRFNTTFAPTTSRLNTQLIADQQPPPATPTISTTANGNAASTPVNTNTLSGPASDDSGSPTTTTNPPSATNPAESATDITPEIAAGAPAEPGTERSGPDGNTPTSDSTGTPPYDNETFNRARRDPGARPGRRLKNPLGSLASYTYQLSLYMITPAAYEAFVASGRRNINLYGEQLATSATTPEQREISALNGAFLIAQGGGVGGRDKRAPGFEYDYYLDNLTFNHVTSSKETGAALANTDFKFQIIEPYGFSLISKLRKARDLMPASTGVGAAPGSTSDPLRQFYILGIRFNGWDQSGRQIKGTETFEGNPIDPFAPGNGALFETFYDITITEFKFKIDGRATVYNIVAQTTGPAAAINVRKGMVNTDIEASGSKVRDLLSGPNGLLTKLNQEQQNLVRNNTITYPIVYKIKWLSDAESIALSSVVTENRTNKADQPSSTATNTAQVNEATATRSSPNNTVTRMNFANKPIVQAIDQVISRSKYLQDSMAYNYTDSNENNPDTAAPNIVRTPNQKFTWFHISPEISDIRWDPIINDWSYSITYIIQTYLAPFIDNPFVTNNTPYYGPHKRYDYWYTGQNTEIIKFEQTYNNLYQNNVVAGNPAAAGNAAASGNTASTTNSNAASSGPGAVTAPNTSSTADRDGSGGTLSTEAVNSVRTTLYDPASYATAKFEILGDPDFLMQEVPTVSTGLNETYANISPVYDAFYRNGGFTINPTGGKVFFEVDFKEAVDYSTSGIQDTGFADGKGVTGQGGTMSINDSILFLPFQDDVSNKINGVIYSLTTVSSSFKNGVFTQTLDAVQPFGTGDLSSDTSAAATAREEEAAPTSNGTSTDQPGENANTGTPPDASTGGPAPQRPPATSITRVSSPRISRPPERISRPPERISRPPGGLPTLDGPEATS
jgi:hypothetical protein